MTTYYHPSTQIGLGLYWTGDIEASRSLLEQAARRALTRGEEWDRLGVLLVLAFVDWEMGRQQLAEQHRQAAQEALGEYASGDPVAAISAVDAALLAHTECRRPFEHGSRDRSNDSGVPPRR